MQSKFFSIKAGGTGLYPKTPLNDFYDLDLDSNSSPTKIMIIYFHCHSLHFELVAMVFSLHL